MNNLQKIAVGLITLALLTILTILFGDKIKFLVAILIPIIVLIGLVKLLKLMRDIKNGKFEDLRLDLGVSDVKTYYRYGLSIGASIIATLLLWSLDTLMQYDLINSLVFWAIFVLVVIYFAQTEENETIVPAGKVAVVMFWGFRYRIFLSEGKYSWTGKSLGIHLSTEERTEGVTPEGFVNAKDFPMSIWNLASERDKLRLECLASDNASEVFTTLTLLVRIIDPIKWINSEDPALDLADKAREALRGIIAFFTAIDNTKMKLVYWEMMRGKTIITVFTPKDTNEYIKGTVIRSAGGAPMYEVVDDLSDDVYEKIDEEMRMIEQGLSSRTEEEREKEMKRVYKTLLKRETDKQTERQKESFSKKLQDDANQEMLEGCLVQGKLKVETRSVATIFTDVMDRLGVTVDSATIGNIDVSEVVTDSANKAASEPAQRSAQIASAKTDRDAALFRKEARDKGVTEFELGVSAAADNENIKVVITGGGNSNKLKDAAATHAALSQNNGGKK